MGNPNASTVLKNVPLVFPQAISTSNASLSSPFAKSYTTLPLPAVSKLGMVYSIFIFFIIQSYLASFRYVILPAAMSYRPDSSGDKKNQCHAVPMFRPRNIGGGTSQNLFYLSLNPTTPLLHYSITPLLHYSIIHYSLHQTTCCILLFR